MSVFWSDVLSPKRMVLGSWGLTHFPPNSALLHMELEGCSTSSLDMATPVP